MDTYKSVTVVRRELRVMYTYLMIHNTESVSKLVSTSTSDPYVMILH